MAEETKSEKSDSIEKIDAADIKIKKSDGGKSDKPSKDIKKGKPSLIERFKKFIKDYKSELKKIVWPTRTQTIQNTGVVIIAILFMTIVVGLMDLIFGWGITGLSHIKTLFTK